MSIHITLIIFIVLFASINHISSKPMHPNQKGTKFVKDDETKSNKDGIPPYPPGQICSAAGTENTGAIACVPPNSAPPPPSTQPPTSTPQPTTLAPTPTTPAPTPAPTTPSTPAPTPAPTTPSTPAPTPAPTTPSTPAPTWPPPPTTTVPKPTNPEAVVEMSPGDSSIWKMIKKQLSNIQMG